MTTVIVCYRPSFNCVCIQAAPFLLIFCLQSHSEANDSTYHQSLLFNYYLLLIPDIYKYISCYLRAITQAYFGILQL